MMARLSFLFPINFNWAAATRERYISFNACRTLAYDLSQFDVRMSDRPVIPGAPLRGVFKVMLVRDAAQAIDFSYVFCIILL